MNEPAPVVLTPAQLKAAATLRVERAMALIEQAQRNLETACGELSGLEGGLVVWKMCHTMTDKVHQFWYRVQKFRMTGKYRLDRTHVETLQNRIAADRRKAAEATLLAAKEPPI